MQAEVVERQVQALSPGNKVKDVIRKSLAMLILFSLLIFLGGGGGGVPLNIYPEL